jgi:hypothetical protein
MSPVPSFVLTDKPVAFENTVAELFPIAVLGEHVKH